MSENLQRSRGIEPVERPIEPEPGNVWPGPPQPLPTLSDVSRNGGQTNGVLLGGAGLPNGGTMSAGEQNSIRGGAGIDQDGFGGAGGGPSGGQSGGGLSGGGLSGGGLSATVPDPSTKFHSKGVDSSGKIVIPNGDGTSTVISPDGSVQTVKDAPK
ncbi:hypothetical protein [Lichenicola sp.]|uniref:hypothetical protein n=1 Tax=Lichenicola sp. TaxID=2804529 RepID=UPI003AFFB0A9